MICYSEKWKSGAPRVPNETVRKLFDGQNCEFCSLGQVMDGKFLPVVKDFVHLPRVPVV